MNDEELDQDMLRALAKQTAALPREIEPPANAWDRIRSEIESDRIVSITETRRTRWWQRPQLLIAAGLILVAGSSYVTSMILKGRANEPSTIAVSETPSAASESLVRFTSEENNYIATANRLTEILDGNHNDLAPETVAKLRESVRVIDAAILEARRALAADPSNKALMDMVIASYSQKVDLLKRTTEMGQS